MKWSYQTGARRKPLRCDYSFGGLPSLAHLVWSGPVQTNHLWSSLVCKHIIVSFCITKFFLDIDAGYYITPEGKPARLCGYLRWETRATSYAQCKKHLLLFSPQFIEIRAVRTGKLVQVIKGQDIRLLHSGEDTVLVAMKKKVRVNGQRLGEVEDVLIELIPTQGIEATPPKHRPKYRDDSPDFPFSSLKSTPFSPSPSPSPSSYSYSSSSSSY